MRCRQLNPESVAIAEKNSQNQTFQEKFYHPRKDRVNKSLPASPFAYLLHKWRSTHNLYAKQAADILGVPFDTYRGWESGKHLPALLARHELKRRMEGYKP